jgi:hypothetical protein
LDVRAIIGRLGGQTAVAKAIGKGQSTVGYWVQAGTIPAKWHARLLDVAERLGAPLTADDFVSRLGGVAAGEPETAPPPIQALDVLAPPADPFLDSPAASPFLFYSSDSGTVKVRVMVEDETVWASQRGMADIFHIDVRTVSEHLVNIFSTGELTEGDDSVIRKFRITAADGKSYETNFYSLDAIISVGYRVNSMQATQFRRWATGVLREYLVKGFALDDERLKAGSATFGKDYFDELLERIREIRASERRFYQKITDIYSQCSADYDKNADITQKFYAHVQDKLHFAVHGRTSAELISSRADATKPHMGLQSWKNEARGGKITKMDVTVGKNYLNREELEELNRLVSMYLDTAEGFARRRKIMTMRQWAEKLDGFLEFNAYNVLRDFGRVRRDAAENRAIREYEKFRVVQDVEYKSDFDRVVDEVKAKKLKPRASASAPQPPSSQSPTAS